MRWLVLPSAPWPLTTTGSQLVSTVAEWALRYLQSYSNAADFFIPGQRLRVDAPEKRDGVLFPWHSQAAATTITTPKEKYSCYWNLQSCSWNFTAKLSAQTPEDTSTKVPLDYLSIPSPDIKFNNMYFASCIQSPCPHQTGPQILVGLTSSSASISGTLAIFTIAVFARCVAD